MTRVILIILAFVAMAVPAAALGDDGGSPPTPPVCGLNTPPPCVIIVQPPPPCDNTVPGSVCPEGPPQFIQQKLEGPIPLLKGTKKNITITHQDPRYSDVVAALSKIDSAQARCWSWADWAYLGPYFGPGVLGVTLSKQTANIVGDFTLDMDNKVQLAPDICPRLDIMVYRHKYPRSSPEVVLEMATALAVLTHESQHVGGYTDESEAQCMALQRMESAGVMLGLPKAYAHRLSQTFYKYGQGSMPLAYQNDKCRNGGLWDVNAGPGWPS